MRLIIRLVLQLIGITLVCLTLTVALAIGGAHAQAPSSPPMKLAVFDIELDDFTAG